MNPNKCILRHFNTINKSQANHIPLSPGKKHSVQLQGTHITTSKNPVAWRFESRLLAAHKVKFGRHMSIMKHILCIQIYKLFAALLEMESLAPETRGCRFQWEADQLKFHSRFLHLFYFSARLFLFIFYSSQPSSFYWSPDLS